MFPQLINELRGLFITDLVPPLEAYKIQPDIIMLKAITGYIKFIKLWKQRGMQI